MCLTASVGLTACVRTMAGSLCHHGALSKHHPLLHPWFAPPHMSPSLGVTGTITVILGQNASLLLPLRAGQLRRWASLKGVFGPPTL